MFRSGMKTLIISNEEMKNIIKIVKSFEESRLSIKGVSETIQIEAKEQKGEFLSVLLGTFSASLLGYILTGKRKIKGSERTIRTGQDLWCHLAVWLILKYKSII